MYKTLYSEEYQKLRIWLKNKRKASGLSMRDLGEKLDVPHSFVGKIENGDRRLDVIEYIQYCKALNAAPSEGLDIILSKR